MHSRMLSVGRTRPGPSWSRPARIAGSTGCPARSDLDGVIRVELDWSCARGAYTAAGTHEAPVFRTCGYPRSIPGVDPERNLKGLSFAVANVTGITARMMIETGVCDYQALVAELSRRAR